MLKLWTKKYPCGQKGSRFSTSHKWHLSNIFKQPIHLKRERNQIKTPTCSSDLFSKYIISFYILEYTVGYTPYNIILRKWLTYRYCKDDSKAKNTNPMYFHIFSITLFNKIF